MQVGLLACHLHQTAFQSFVPATEASRFDLHHFDGFALVFALFGQTAHVILKGALRSAGRLECASCVAASGGAPPGGPGGAPVASGGPPGPPAGTPGRAPAAPISAAMPPFTPQACPAVPITDPSVMTGGLIGAMSKGAPDMKITPFTPTPCGP